MSVCKNSEVRQESRSVRASGLIEGLRGRSTFQKQPSTSLRRVCKQTMLLVVVEEGKATPTAFHLNS